MAYHHCVNAQFPYESRFDEDGAVFIPELGKTVRRKTYPYVCDAYAYYVEENGVEKEIFCDSTRHYAFWPVAKKESLIPDLPVMYLYNDADGVYYFHVFWEKKHYAVPICFDVPENQAPIVLQSNNRACRLVGFEVNTFEGIDTWKQEYMRLMEKENERNTSY